MVNAAAVRGRSCFRWHLEPPGWAAAAAAAAHGVTAHVGRSSRRRRSNMCSPHSSRDGRMAGRIFVSLVVLVLSLLSTAAAAAACDPQVLSGCPLIRFEEWTRAFPVIEYCMTSDRGFVPAEREACERFGLGQWRVRPDWAARNASLTDQYACAVCTARRRLLAAPEEEAVWLLTLTNATTFDDADFGRWSAQLGSGVRLDQLVVSPSGARYLFAFAAAKPVADLLALAGPRHILAAQPFPPELKISPRVADYKALKAATATAAATGTPTDATDTSAMKPSTSTAASTPPTVTALHVQTLVVEGEAGSEARAARRQDGLNRIRVALGLAPVLGGGLGSSRNGGDDPALPPQEVGIWTGAASNASSPASSSAPANTTSSTAACANCTVEAAGEGAYVVNNLPLPIAGAAARNISRALAAALVIDLAVPFRLFNKEAAFLLQSGTNSTGPGAGHPLWERGLTGASEVIGVADSGLDYTSCFFHDSANPVAFKNQYDTALGGYYPVFRSETHRKIREYFGYADAREGTAGGHGTHVCGSIAGYPGEMASSSQAYNYRGAAYDARLAFFDIGFPDADWLEIPRDLATGLFPRAYAVGARMHSNSWGASIGGNSEEMHQTDRWLWERQDFVVLYAAGNDGGNGDGTIGTPAEAKNSITVGATTNNVADPDVAPFSSRGPTFDNRFGVDVCAPGFWVSSAYSFGGSGSAPNQCYIVQMAGTSMATPQLAGATALLREYFTSGHYPLGYPSPAHAMTPMGALLKAVLVNSAQRMLGYEANKHNGVYGISYPNVDQGWGAVALKYATYFEGGASPNVLFVDGAWSDACALCPKLSQGQTATYTITPTSDAPIKITLAWYDFPASAATTSKALVNNLDLTAAHAGATYYANGGNSPTVGVNTRNNVEQIVIPRPTPGNPVTVRVAATSVVRGPQPYAIAVTGHFRKDVALFPQAVPRVASLATDGDEALLVGANLPRSPSVPQSLNFTCLSDPTITNLTAQVTAYSAAAFFLALRLSTTNCSRFALQITSDGFIGDATTLNYGDVNVASVCNQVAADGACQGLSACAGRCIDVMAPSGDDGAHHKFNPTIVIIVAVVGVAVMVLCCCCWRGSYIMRKHEARTGVAPAPASPRHDPERDQHQAPVAVFGQPAPLPRRVPPPKPVREHGTVVVLSPSGSGRRVASPAERVIVVWSPPPSVPPADEHDRHHL